MSDEELDVQDTPEYENTLQLAPFKLDDMLSKPAIEDQDAERMVRNIRIEAIKALTQNGSIPVDKDGFAMFHKNLEAIEKAVLANKRIAVDTEVAGNLAEIARISSQEAYARIKREEAASLAETGEARRAVGVIPDPSSHFDNMQVTVVQGELEVGSQELSYENWRKDFGDEYAAKRKAGG